MNKFKTGDKVIVIKEIRFNGVEIKGKVAVVLGPGPQDFDYMIKVKYKKLKINIPVFSNEIIKYSNKGLVEVLYV